MSVLDSLQAYSTKVPKGTKHATWQEARDASIKDNLPEQLRPNHVIGCHKNSPNPSSWIVQGYDKTKPANELHLIDEFWISWRIVSNMVYFTPQQRESKNGYLGPLPTVEAAREALKALGEEIKAGDHDEAIQEAWDRKYAKEEAAPSDEDAAD